MLTSIDAPTKKYTRLRETGASVKPDDSIALYFYCGQLEARVVGERRIGLVGDLVLLWQWVNHGLNHKLLDGTLTDGEEASLRFVEREEHQPFGLWRGTPFVTALSESKVYYLKVHAILSTSPILVLSSIISRILSIHSSRYLQASLHDLCEIHLSSTAFRILAKLVLQHQAATECLLCTSTNCGNGC